MGFLGFDRCKEMINNQKDGPKKDYANYTNVPGQTKKISTSNDCLEAEFGAVAYKNDLVYAKFSENDRVTSKKDSIAFVSNLRLMNSKGDTNWLPQLAVPNKLISGVTFLPENTGLYYCLCDKVNLMEVRCDIYFRKFNQFVHYFINANNIIRQ